MTLLITGMLFGGLVWLNKHFEQKTKDHLYEFKNKWNALEKKYAK